MNHARIVEYFRVGREHACDATAKGWRFEAGWFRRASGLEWAWFSREIEESERHGTEYRPYR